MESLKDWYRYVDRMSRPAGAREAGEDDVPSQPWRPWMETPGPAAAALQPLERGETPSPAGDPSSLEALEQSILPALGRRMGRRTGAFSPARVEFEDLTVNDTLEPMPLFGDLALEAPAFEVSIPSLVRSKSEDDSRSAPPALVSAELAPDPSQASAAAGAGGLESGPEPARAAPSTLREGATAAEPRSTASTPPGGAMRNWELLAQIRGRHLAPGGYKPPLQESREELVQRLLDPELTLEETARLLDVCTTTVRRYTNRGLLRHFRTPGNQRRFRLSDVMEFMENRVALVGDDSDLEDFSDLPA